MNKTLLATLLSALAAMAAPQMGRPAGQAPVEAPAPVTTAKATSKASPTLTIPQGAVKVDEATYRFQEPAVNGKPGKVWLYRKSPFGVTRIEESEAAKIGAANPMSVESPAKVTDLGDSYRFERTGPFGAKIWTKKKSELSAEEADMVKKSTSGALAQKAAN